MLLSEGSSLSAREAVLALGPLGYTIDVCDTNPRCLSRFSRYVRRYYRRPAFGTDPFGYFSFMVDLLDRGQYDVLLPVHDQGLVVARLRERLAARIGVALGPFDSFTKLQNKVAFIGVLDDLGLPRPTTRVVQSRAELEEPRAFPFYVKTAYGTAARGVWLVESSQQQSRVIDQLERAGQMNGRTELLVQDVAPGVLGLAQGVFDHGRLVAAHCSMLVAEGVGKNACARIAVHHPLVREHLAQIGQYLGWHGGLKLDYLTDPGGERPQYIEADRG